MNMIVKNNEVELMLLCHHRVSVLCLWLMLAAGRLICQHEASAIQPVDVYLLFLLSSFLFFFSVSGILHNHCAQFCQLATKYPRKETTREFDLKLVAKRKRQSCRREKWSKYSQTFSFTDVKYYINMYVFYRLSFSFTFVFVFHQSLVFILLFVPVAF